MISNSRHLKRMVLVAWMIFASSGIVFAAREVRVGAYDYPPLVSRDAKGAVVGIFPEILADIAQREGLKLTYVFGTWEENLKWVKSGEIDIILGIAQVRGKEPYYSVNKEPVLFSWSQLYTAKGKKAISLMDLDGKTVVGLRGDMNLQVFKDLAAPFGINIHYMEVDDIDMAFQMVVHGVAVAAISERITSQIFEKKYAVERNPVMFSPQSLAFGTAKDKNQDLLDAFDRYLNAAKADTNSRYYQILQNWKETEPFEIPPYILWSFVGALGLLVLSVGGNMLLKHQVEWKTIELSDQNLALQGEIAERKRIQDDLRRAKEVAESANNAKDQFIAVLSHELRTPLTPVMALIEDRQTQEGLNPPDIEIIRRNVELESKLIDDLLDATRIKHGKLELHREVTDAFACLHLSLDICRPEMGAKHQKLTLNLDAPHHYILGDPARIQQVFWNLIKNAVKFTPENGEIRIQASNFDSSLKIEIADTGVGIEPEFMPFIFHAFEQGEKTKARRYGGLGLGLHIAEAIIKMHEGSLKCFSKGKDQGATFAVELPVVLAENQQPKPSSAPAIQPNSTQKILLVEDDADTLQTMSRLLERWGYSVTTADCVQSALAAASKRSFNLLVSDLGLPDGSGMDIIRQVKSKYGLRGIAFSGFGTDDDIHQSRAAGFEDHLVKPINLSALRAAIQRITSSVA